MENAGEAKREMLEEEADSEDGAANDSYLVYNPLHTDELTQGTIKFEVATLQFETCLIEFSQQLPLSFTVLFIIRPQNILQLFT